MRSVMGRQRAVGSSARGAALDMHLLPVSVLVFSDVGLAHSNRQWTALSGLSPAASCGDGWLAAVHPDDRASMTSCTRPDGQFCGGQVRLRNVVDGTESWVQPQTRVTGSAANPVVVVTLTEIGALKAAQADLRSQARHDPMTGLLNKVAFLEEVDARLVAGAADDRHAAVFFIDLDAFKSVNDRWGHAAGDQVLVTAAQRLQAAVRPNDLVGRLGGDELAVFQVTPRDESVDVTAERLAAVLAEPCVFDGRSIGVTASVGVAASVAAVRASTLVDRADRAMYRAKAVNRGNRHDDAEQRRAMAVPAAAAIAIASAPPVDPLRPPQAAWDGPAWTDDDLWDGGSSRRPRAARGLSRTALTVAAVTAIVLLGWTVRSVSVGSGAARAFAASVTASATTTGTTHPPATSARRPEQVTVPTLPPVTTVVASSAPTTVPTVVELAPTAADDSTPTPTATPTPPIVAAPTDRPRTVAPTTPAPKPPAAAAPTPTAAAAPATIPATPAPPAPTTAAPTTPTAAPKSTAPPTAAPPPKTTVTSAPTTVAAPAPVPPPATTVATTKAPPPPKTKPTPPPPTTFVHVVAAGEDPAQIAAWLSSIGEGKAYKSAPALHQALPAGTVITVTNGTVTVSGP